MDRSSGAGVVRASSTCAWVTVVATVIAGIGCESADAPEPEVIPCAVDNVVETGCRSCHGAMPIGGAPMSLRSLADFQRDYTAKSTWQLRGRRMKLYELARIRINRERGTSPMPQGTLLKPDAFATLDGWLRARAPAGAACPGGESGAASPPTIADAGQDGVVPGAASKCDLAGAFDAPEAREGETCWEFPAHGTSSPSDNSKFDVPIDESYAQFYFDVPWPAGSVATRHGTDFDNLQVVHHWLAFSSTAGDPHGTVVRNATGTTLGENAELIGGWALGGCSSTYPDDVGVQLPSSGKIMVQWHYFNSTGRPQQDGSRVQICTMPEGSRPNIAGVTFLGTEDLGGFRGMDLGEQSFSGTCPNDSGAPITIIAFTPHMHTIGSNMRSVVTRAEGGKETIFDHPFAFDQQVTYDLDPPYVLRPGDSITTTCTYQNDTGSNVPYGQSTKEEMCYQFALAYPYRALSNGVASQIGATNTCW